MNAGYFICNGPHRAKDCPKPEKLNAMVAEDEKGQSDEEVPSRVNPLQLLNALSAGGNSKGEMNGNKVEAMLDTSATHNFG